jgi:putative toxin-antitoxin system antitoxin component (TIGR02293 family)
MTRFDKCLIYLDKILNMKKSSSATSKAGYSPKNNPAQVVSDRDFTSDYLEVNDSNSIAYSSNWESFFQATQRGVLVADVLKVMALGPFKAEFYCDALDISTKTLDRHVAEKKRLNPNDSELLLKWKAMYIQGKETFDSYDAFGGWLQKPAFGLNGIVPKELMKTSRGIDLIINELKRIEWGQLA